MLQGLNTHETRDAAREVKFTVPLALSNDLVRWSREQLTADPHAAGASGDEYRTTTLYFDTGALDVYFRRGSFSRSKYRVRRYGASDTVFLERKLRTSERLIKRRTTIKIGGLRQLAAGTWEAGMGGFWFQQRLLARRLRPVCQVSYRRIARVGVAPSGPMRLTIDSQIAARSNSALEFKPDGGVPVLAPHVVVEIKYRADMPALFARLMQEFGLEPALVSKYRASMLALGQFGDAAGQLALEAEAEALALNPSEPSE